MNTRRQLSAAQIQGTWQGAVALPLSSIPEFLKLLSVLDTCPLKHFVPRPKRHPCLHGAGATEQCSTFRLILLAHLSRIG